ncbi:hypothetical protein TraAM80_10092 [Trypanosoma rangeli]|uniref:Retrotransposon hot spot (RHS) protein n=1 Tax=Trypanosoma rangeli TaxID=5698 RepID=A0A422MRG9_TRYRA|nr:uncharacterized protein TraAM80_10092 [Trypanosoma rangeli]RNE95794.1 hypothetical protein TraAM80_10092 [Trypanosoma rangeli]|eukprot:RNE95794.1 hypothetical protein TraAM80_10092 [Trypanosoma rangeli]
MCGWRCLCVGQTGTLQSRGVVKESSIPPGYQLSEDARKLTERMVGTLRDWKEFTDKGYCLCYYTNKTEGNSSTSVGGRGNTGNRNTPQMTITGGILRVRV